MIDVIHPGVRATGASVLSLFQNLFGLAARPVHRRRAVGRARASTTALAIMPAFGLVAVGALLIASRTYETDMKVPARASGARAVRFAPTALSPEPLGEPLPWRRP